MAIPTCPRCKGFLYARQDEDFNHCMNCGFNNIQIPLEVLKECAKARGKASIGSLTGHGTQRKL